MLSQSTEVDHSETPVNLKIACGSAKLRKSISDPTDSRPRSGHKFVIHEIDRCFSLLSGIGKSIEKSENLLKMTGSCKWCHAPVGSSGAHVGSKWGYDICTLSHSALCPGGVTAIPNKRMACPLGYVTGMVLDYPDDPRDNSTASDSDSYMSDQHTSQLESESAIDDEVVIKQSEDLPVVEKNEAPLIDLTNKNFLDLENKASSVSNKLPVVSKLASVSLSTVTSVSWSSASTRNPASNSLLFPAPTPGLYSSNSSSSFIIQDPNHLLQQQLAEMKKQQVLQLKKDQERDSQLALMQQQLKDAQKVALEARSEASTRRKSSRNVSFSTGPSSGGELADQAAKLAARAQRKARHKVNNIGVDMNDIRNSPGMDDTVDDFMQSVTSIPSLSLGSKVPASASARKNKEPSQNKNPAASDSVHQTPYSVDGAGVAGSGIGTDQSSIAALLTQQQTMMTKFLDFQQQQEVARQQQQLQVQSWMQQLQISVHNPVQHQRPSPSSAEKRADRSAQENLENARRQAKIDSFKDNKKKCDDEYDAALKQMEKARRAKKYAEKQLAGATDSDCTESELPVSSTVRNLSSQLFSSQNSDDSPETKKHKKAEKKKRQREKRLAEAGASSNLISSAGSRQSAPVPRPTRQGKTGDDTDNEKLLSIAEWAKLCPVKYASSCTAKNINLPMWVWGKLAEIRAALSGNITPLASGELGARLRHMQCVLEVCNQNSTPAEYTPYGWRLARNYDARVQAMMDTKVSDWVSFNSCFNMGPHPSFFLSAMNEVEKTEKKKEDPKDLKKRRTVKCDTFNTCKTKKKCDYEVNNPNAGRCKKLHECSHCQKTRQESLFHQWWDCGHGGRESFAAENQ